MRLLRTTKRLTRLVRLARNADRHLVRAHEIAASEPDTESRRVMYRHLYYQCLFKGRWRDARIFQPFAGVETGEVGAKRCLEAAVASGRAEDALECAEWAGVHLSAEQAKSLARDLGRPGGPVLLRQLLEVVAGWESEFGLREWGNVATAAATGRLSRAETLAFALAKMEL